MGRRLIGEKRKLLLGERNYSLSSKYPSSHMTCFFNTTYSFKRISLSVQSNMNCAVSRYQTGVFSPRMFLLPAVLLSRGVPAVEYLIYFL